jgi:hypothetical protein
VVANVLHYKSTTICACLGYDDVFDVLLRGDVDSAVAFGYSNLCETSCGEREDTEDCEQHFGSAVTRYSLSLSTIKFREGSRQVNREVGQGKPIAKQT